MMSGYCWEVIAAHSRSPGDIANSSFVGRDFRTIILANGGIDENFADQRYRDAQSKLVGDGVITHNPNLLVFRYRDTMVGFIHDELKTRERLK